MKNSPLLQVKEGLDEFKRTHPYSTFKPHSSPELTQKRFIEDKALRKAIFGGNQSGKTTSLAVLAIKTAKERRGTIWAGAPSFDLSRQGLQRKIWELLDIEDRRINDFTEERGFRDDSCVITCTGGGVSTIYFKSYEQGAGKWGSATLIGVFLDEEPPWDILQESIARVARHNGIIAIAMTALRYKTRLVNLIYFTPPEQSNWKVYRMSVYENHVKYGGVYTDAKIHELEMSYDPRDIPARIHGIPTLKTGLVYDMFCDSWPWVLPAEKEFAIPAHWSGYEAIDPHARTPNAVLFGAVEPNGRLWIYDYICSTEPPKVIWPMVLEKRVRANGRIVEPEIMRMDGHGGRHYIDVIEKKTFYDLWCEAGASPILTHIPIEVRIPLVRQYMKIHETLRTPKVIIFESVQPIIQEILGYVWDEHVSEKTADRMELKQVPVNKNNHYISCLEYIIGAGCDYYKPHERLYSRQEKYQVINRMESYAT